MTLLPEPPATTIGQAANPLTDAVISAAVDNAIHEARRHGTAPAAQKPERPAMSQKATDDSVRMIAFGGMSLMVCAGGGIVMIASDFADPTVIGVSLGGLAALVLAVARLVRRAGEAAPTEIHQTYTGNVHQETRITHTRAVWSKTVNRD
jgi:hypothetical protein